MQARIRYVHGTAFLRIESGVTPPTESENHVNEQVTANAPVNPFAFLVGYTQLRYPLRSVDSSTQLHLVLRPDLESPRQARSIELLGTTRVGS
jgi:hypothetical protein